jgi:hypothetical protein
MLLWWKFQKVRARQISPNDIAPVRIRSLNQQFIPHKKDVDVTHSRNCELNNMMT